MFKIIVIMFFMSVSLFAKEFVLKTIDGKDLNVSISPLSVKVDTFPGRVVIFDFFGANCPPCIAEMPDLVKLQETFGKSVQIIGIQAASKRDDKAMAKFAKEHHLNYPVVNLDAATDLIIYAQEQTDWNGALPYKLVYDFDGNLSYRLYGKMDWEKLIGVLHDL